MAWALLFFGFKRVYFLERGSYLSFVAHEGSKAINYGSADELGCIYAFLIINDMIETDKVGTIFFLCVAGLVRIDLLNQQPELLEQPNTGQDSE